jgi:hypothetical protein
VSLQDDKPSLQDVQHEVLLLLLHAAAVARSMNKRVGEGQARDYQIKNKGTLQRKDIV